MPGEIKNARPAINPPVAKKTSPTLLIVPLKKLLNIPAYNNKLQKYNGTYVLTLLIFPIIKLNIILIISNIHTIIVDILIILLISSFFQF